MSPKWGRQEPDSPIWTKRYKTLLSEGFVVDEAYELASGVISSSAMLKGRRTRRAWFKELRKDRPKISLAELNSVVDGLYDTSDWGSPYDQFYEET